MLGYASSVIVRQSKFRCAGTRVWQSSTTAEHSLLSIKYFYTTTQRACVVRAVEIGMAKTGKRDQQQADVQGKTSKRQQQAKGGQDEGLSHYVSNLQVLAGDIDHNSPSLMLFVDKWGRMLFNAGEGLQRLIRENKLRIRDMDNFMFTRVSTETLSGLPGLLLSYGGKGGADDAGGLLDEPINTAHLYGPAGLSQYISAFRHYVNQDQPLNTHEIGGGQKQVVKNAYITVTAVTINPQAHVTSSNSEEPPPAKRQRSSNSISPSLLPSSAYVVELAGVPGKFDNAAATALGLPFGPVRGRLQKGQTITLDDGRVIEPHQVRSPDQPGPLIIVLDLPSQQHVDTLVRDKLLNHWLPTTQADGNQTALQRHCVIAHLSPAAMVSSPAYQSLMATFGPDVKHLLCSSGPAACTLKRATALQAKLNCISPVLFPMLQPPGEVTEHRLPATASDNGSAQSLYTDLPGLQPQQAVLGTCLLRYNLTPVKTQGVDMSEIASELDIQKVRADYVANNQTVIDLAKQAVGVSGDHDVYTKQAVTDVTANSQPPQPAETSSNGAGGDVMAVDQQQGQQTVNQAGPSMGLQHPDVPACLQGISRQECEITFLGTASSCPSKYRNVTALYVDCFARGGLLLDCGEDTLGQMKRRYGAAEAERRVLELRLLWVSHMHADHHGGLYRLLELRHERLLAAHGTAQPLLIVGPGKLFSVLQDYQRAIPFSFLFLPNEQLTWGLPGKGAPPYVMQAFEQAQAALQLKVQPFPVHHVGGACGVKLTGGSGWAVVFSGDTRPCRQTEEAAADAVLLIHEATFEDDKQEDAIRKKHSTTGEALGVAAKAGVYRVVLTHFSTRYPTMPVLDISAHPNMAVACDFMSINLADLPWLPRITRPLAALFKREAAGWEQDEQASTAAPAVIAAPTNDVKQPSATQAVAEQKHKNGKKQKQ